MTYRNSLSRRPFSAASFVGVTKIASNPVIREERSWIFFPTATVSCRRVRRESILSEGSQTNFVFLINGGDDTQGGFERTERLRRLLCDVEENAADLKCGVRPTSLRIW